MIRQNPWPHAMGNIILIAITVFEILDHCQNLLDDPRSDIIVMHVLKFIFDKVSISFNIIANTFGLDNINTH